MPDDYADSVFLKYHQEKGAEIISSFLRENNAPEDLIKNVARLVSHHEVGGDSEQDALMNADSVGFFDTQAELFVKKKAPTEGYDKIKIKLDWMFNRITLDEAKKEAKPSYKLWITELNKLKSSSNAN